MEKKRFIIALALAAAVAVGYIVFLKPDTPPAPEPTAPQPATQTAAKAAPHPAPATAETAPSAPAAPEAATASAAPAPAPQPAAEPAQTQPAGQWRLPLYSQLDNIIIGSNAHSGDEMYLLRVQLSTQGAGVQTVKLSRHFATVEDRQLFDECDGDTERYEQLAAENPARYQGFYSLINPVYRKSTRGGLAKAEPELALATRWLHVAPEGIAYPPMPEKTLEVEAERDVGGTTRKEIEKVTKSVDYLATRNWQLDAASRTENSVTFVMDIALSDRDYTAAAPGSRVRVSKTYTVKKNDYTIYVTLKIENLFDRRVQVSFDQGGPHGVPREAISTDPDARAVAYLTRAPGDDKDQTLALVRKTVLAELVSRQKDSPNLAVVGLPQVVATTEEGTPWIADLNQYFGTILQPIRPAGSAWKTQFYCARAVEPGDSPAFTTGMIVDGITLEAGQTQAFNFEVFAGPKKRDMFVDSEAPYYRQRYQDGQYISTLDITRGGFCGICSFDWLALGMMWLLQKLTLVTFGNYGLALMILVVLVRVVLHPLTRKGQMSMMKMQKLGPQMAKLKEKYADDKDTLQKEQMKFYKEQGASPVLGCLPMLLQMPIWIALWTMLQASVELRHAAFLPFWLTDLSAPDKLFSWGTALPVTGWTDFNLLPLLLTVAMFLQTKFSPQAGGPSASEQQQQQQKMMKWMMPIMMLWIFYPRPSGLCLYIMTSTFAGVAEQWFIRRHIKQKEAAEAAMETTISVPGKGMRGKRPKKAKGPFWTKGG